MLRSDQAPTALVVLLLDMHVCVELDQLGESAIIFIPTVLVFVVPSLIICWRSCSCNSSSTHTPTH